MSGSSKKVILAALVGNALVAVTKFIAAAMTGSSAMLSEGIHSVVDTGNQVLLLYGMRKQRNHRMNIFRLDTVRKSISGVLSSQSWCLHSVQAYQFIRV